MVKRLDLKRTRAALAEYDRTKPIRDQAWEDVENNMDQLKCEAANHAALTKVREAFALDTADRNSRDNAMLATLDFIRRLLK